jgi:hypothetical protein
MSAARLAALALLSLTACADQDVQPHRGAILAGDEAKGDALASCDPEGAPLALEPLDVGSTFDAVAAGFDAGCPAGYSWCSLDDLTTYTVPACAAGASLEAVVERALAADPGIEAGFQDGAVLSADGLADSFFVHPRYSTGGPALFDAIDQRFGGGAEAWEVAWRGTCHNCSESRNALVLWYPQTSSVVVLEGTEGYDS